MDFGKNLAYQHFNLCRRKTFLELESSKISFKTESSDYILTHNEMFQLSYLNYIYRIFENLGWIRPSRLKPTN